MSAFSILDNTIRYNGTSGYVVADDYNFLVRQYNLSRAITSAVEKKKLPEAFRKELAEYYSGEIIRNGNDKNVQSEIDLIAKIPDGGKAFVCGTGNNLSGVEQIKETDLKDLIISVYPGFRNQNRETWKKALALTELINPYIEHQRIRNRETKEYTDVYTLLPGKVILLPDESVLLNARPPERKL